MKKKNIFLTALILLLAGVIMVSTSVASSQNKKVVKLGFIGPFSGGSAYEGLGAKNCFDLAVKQANASGKYNYKYEAIFLDDESSPATGVGAALRLTSDPDVIAAAGHWNSPVALATIQIFHRFKMPFMVWASMHPDITKQGYPEITRISSTLDVENIDLAKTVVSEWGYKRWSIISDSTVYGLANVKFFGDSVKEYGGEVISTDFAPVGTLDFRPILQKINILKPDGIYTGNVVMEGALIKLQMEKEGMNYFYAANSGLYPKKFFEITKEASEGTVVTKPGIPMEKLEAWATFKEAYDKEGYKEPAGWYSLYAYDAANILINAIEKVGLDREKVVEEIRKTKHEGLTGDDISFNEEGQNIHTGNTLYVAQDGDWVLWEESEYATGKRQLPPPAQK
jgi:branched-chain amino acid transport system substrate-binding protein